MCYMPSQTNPYYVKPRLADHQFGIKHYAGEVSFLLYLDSSLQFNNWFFLFISMYHFFQVLYDVKGILEKNRDTFRDDILNMLKDSRLDYFYIQDSHFVRPATD